MRTIAYYVWKVEIAIRNLLGIKTECRYCKKWDGKNGCKLIPASEEWNNYVYFERMGDEQ